MTRLMRRNRTRRLKYLKRHSIRGNVARAFRQVMKWYRDYVDFCVTVGEAIR